MKLFNVFKNIVKNITTLENYPTYSISSTRAQIDSVISTYESTYEKDYVIENGTSGNWTYRKWASGKAECWGYPSVSAAAPTKYSNLYFSGLHDFSFPTGLFTVGPSITVTVERGTNGLFFPSISSSGASQVRIYLASASQETTAATTWFHIIAEGRWKALDT